MSVESADIVRMMSQIMQVLVNYTHQTKNETRPELNKVYAPFFVQVFNYLEL